MINSTIHGYLDYLTILFFLIAPSIFQLSTVGLALAYILAAIHLLMTIFTDFSAGMVDVVPFNIHGYVELVVGIVLAGAPWILRNLFVSTGQLLFSICGVIILAVWLLTDYAAEPNKELT